MKNRRVTWIAVAVAVALVAVTATTVTGFLNTDNEAEAQPVPPGSSMEARLNQVINVLDNAPINNCGGVGGALDRGMEILYGGLRPLPTPEVPETEGANEAVAAAEMQLAQALERFIHNGVPCGDAGFANNPGVKDRALDLKLFIEQMNEVAQAVGEITRQCGPGTSTGEAPCDELAPLLDEGTGEIHQGARQVFAIADGYSVKLRSPFVPQWWWNYTWQEDVIEVPALRSKECAAVIKETQGLAVRLHLQRIVVVTDPWINTFGFPRGTQVPIWTMEWVPTEYIKTIEVCNRAGTLETRVMKRVEQDIPLNFFWRYYPKDP